MKTKLKYLPVAIFLCFIFVIAALFITIPKSDYSSTEKRYLEDFPEVSLQSITDGEFEDGFENYISDHFPFRNLWVGINAYYNYAIGNNGSEGVYKCSDGYLINTPVSSDNRLAANAKTIAEFSQGTDIPVTVMITPSTGYIMEDVLPTVHDSYNDDELFEQIKTEFNKSGNDRLSFVDLRSAFKQATQNGEQLYYKTDHHWTSKGAYTAYTKLCESLGITPSEKSEFDVESYDGFYGTTYSTSGFWLTAADDIEIWNNKNDTEKNITVTITEGDEEQTYHSMYFLNHLDEDDKYPVFLDGNHALETIENSNVDDGKVLIVKDSFCHSLAPFLADNFNTVTMVDMRYYKNSVTDLAEDGDYDMILVIYGIDNFATDTDLAWIK